MNSDDLKKYVVGVAIASTLSILGAMLAMWRDVAIIKTELQHLEAEHRYYHGDFKPPNEEKTR